MQDEVVRGEVEGWHNEELGGSPGWEELSSAERHTPVRQTFGLSLRTLLVFKASIVNSQLLLYPLSTRG